MEPERLWIASAELDPALEAEARACVESGAFVGHIAYACVIARKHG
jgi:hypothetical protein